jgi:hypothetical protein
VFCFQDIRFCPKKQRVNLGNVPLGVNGFNLFFAQSNRALRRLRTETEMFVVFNRAAVGKQRVGFHQFREFLVISLENDRLPMHIARS